MKELFLSTNDSLAPFILRATLALVLFPHGAQKLLGWFGGYGFGGTMGFFTDTVGLPYVIGLMVIFLEFLGPLLLLAGLGTRIIALLIAVLFTGIILTSHLPYGFFMNWSGEQKGEGYEYHLLIIGIALALLTTGGGRFSLDQRWAKERDTSGAGNTRYADLKTAPR